MRRVDPGDAHTSEDQGCKMSENTKLCHFIKKHKKLSKYDLLRTFFKRLSTQLQSTLLLAFFTFDLH